MCSQKKGNLSMRSGTAVGQGGPCERQCDRLRILLRNQSHQEGDEGRMDHVLPFGDKGIREWRGTRRVSSTREGGVSGTRGEIVPEQFQKDRVVWVQVSEMGKGSGD